MAMTSLLPLAAPLAVIDAKPVHPRQFRQSQPQSNNYTPPRVMRHRNHFGPASGAKASLAIEVISDAICPWCWVAKRRLDSAIAALAPDVTASVTWRPFELNPEMPKAGVDRHAYRSAKFGSWQHSQALDAQVAAP
jgi:hypothetical protein